MALMCANFLRDFFFWAFLSLLVSAASVVIIGADDGLIKSGSKSALLYAFLLL